ncbi:hypothetical protein BLA29_013576, partial [Euroglyphus maynei]
CNVIVHLPDVPSSTFLLQNYNEPNRKNCSFYMVQTPWKTTEIMEISLKIIDYEIGNFDNKGVGKFTDHECTQDDYAEVDGGRTFGFVTKLKPSKFQWCGGRKDPCKSIVN